MAEVTRKRRRPKAPGMTLPSMVADAAARQAIAEVQAAIEELAGRIGEAEATGDASDAFDPSELERQLEGLRTELEGMRLTLGELLQRFPVIQYAKVISPGALGTLGDPGNGYHECVFWLPSAEAEMAPVNVAAATEPDVGDVILIARLWSGILDGNGLPVQWQEIAGGGGGGVIIAANYAELNALTGLEDGQIGYVLDLDYFYFRRNGAWERRPWVSNAKLYYHDGTGDHSVSHFET